MTSALVLTAAVALVAAAQIRRLIRHGAWR